MNTSIHSTGDPCALEPDNRGSSAWAELRPEQTSLPYAISSEDLLRGQPSVTIAHHGAIYRLQTTRQGKLILTK